LKRLKNAIYPGSFDPVTIGHLNIIRRAAEIFDHLTVCVMVNAGKNPMFTLEERVELIQRVTRDLPNVDVDFSGELLAEYARKKGKCGTSVRKRYDGFRHIGRCRRK
jgi:pantetheine-phosphate adenylyltransferase